jgi:hypothetical protein
MAVYFRSALFTCSYGCLCQGNTYFWLLVGESKNQQKPWCPSYRHKVQPFEPHPLCPPLPFPYGLFGKGVWTYVRTLYNVHIRYVNMDRGVMIQAGKRRMIWEKYECVLMTIYVPQILHKLCWDWTRACAVRDMRLTCWVMAKPLLFSRVISRRLWKISQHQVVRIFVPCWTACFCIWTAMFNTLSYSSTYERSIVLTKIIAAAKETWTLGPLMLADVSSVHMKVAVHNQHCDLPGNQVIPLLKPSGYVMYHQFSIQ